ncbi:MAG: hypothetical protein DRO87_07570 [Candidatus Thorarchaeota archaeon]|nr:MAG: hypothetical protein DRP09_05570 [Candidatus Thorarchaeota archaeon]RLI56922.1 MAG: hypothetical protein DRO87_07570 [Candidatus Thorarchaeota archaeon]
MEDTKRFILPAMHALLGIVATFMLVNWLTIGLAEARPAYDLIPGVAGTTVGDVSFLLAVFIPIYFVEYAVLTIPIAIFMVGFTKVFRMTTYELGIFPTAKSFDSMKMMRRAIVPALFALSSGETFLNLVPNVLFRVPSIDESTAAYILPWFHPLQTLLGTLIALGVALIIFVPTWILNDSGIVSQVKESHMHSRRCPDTEGIGRWFSNLFGGFAIFTYPIAMFHRYFYLEYFVWNIPPTLDNILISLLWTVGIPLLVMSFVMPFVIINEFVLPKIRPRIQKLARRLGARNVQEERLVLEMTELVHEHLGDEPYDPTKGRTDT